jgi:hypothetical protein
MDPNQGQQQQPADSLAMTAERFESIRTNIGQIQQQQLLVTQTASEPTLSLQVPTPPSRTPTSFSDTNSTSLQAPLPTEDEGPPDKYKGGPKNLDGFIEKGFRNMFALEAALKRSIGNMDRKKEGDSTSRMLFNKPLKSDVKDQLSYFQRSNRRGYGQSTTATTAPAGDPIALDSTKAQTKMFRFDPSEVASLVREKKGTANAEITVNSENLRKSSLKSSCWPYFEQGVPEFVA